MFNLMSAAEQAVYAVTLGLVASGKASEELAKDRNAVIARVFPVLVENN